METLGFCDKSSGEYVKCFLKFMFLHSGLFKILTIHFANCIVKNSTDETNISLVLVSKIFILFLTKMVDAPGCCFKS
jgi:hypothetical protein